MRRSLPRFAKIINYDTFLSTRSRARMPSAIRSLQPLLAEPGMISLGGGMPNPTTFPIKSIQVELTDGGKFELQGESLENVLQYSGTRGMNPLLDHLHSLQTKEHGFAQPEPFEICVTTGSQDALSKAFDLFTGDGPNEPPVLVEEPTYSGSLAYLQPTGTRLVPLQCDAQGLIPESLESTLKNWETNHPKLQDPVRPKVLYTIPTGSNPTGASLTLARKKEIYSIASKYNLLILEDDPYYWMQFVDDDNNNNNNNNNNIENIENKTGRTPSFMSMDVDGRVLRFDSFSKLLSSGIRVGFVTGPPALVERIELHAQASVLHSSGVSQALVTGLFDEWALKNESSYEGFVQHCANITQFYRVRRDAFINSVEKHLSGLVEYSIPDAGMFCWMKFVDVTDADAFIKNKARDAKVLLVPGQSFDPLDRTSPYARAAYSTASVEDMDVAMERLGRLLREQRKERNKDCK